MLLKFKWKCKGSRVASQTNWKKKQIWMSFTDFKTSDKITLTTITTVQYWGKNNYIDQWNTMENIEIKPYIYGQLIFIKGSKAVQQGKNSLFSNRRKYKLKLQLEINAYSLEQV